MRGTRHCAATAKPPWQPSSTGPLTCLFRRKASSRPCRIAFAVALRAVQQCLMADPHQLAPVGGLHAAQCASPRSSTAPVYRGQVVESPAPQKRDDLAVSGRRRACCPAWRELAAMLTTPAYWARCREALRLPQSSVEMMIPTVICHQERHGSLCTVGKQLLGSCACSTFNRPCTVVQSSAAL